MSISTLPAFAASTAVGGAGTNFTVANGVLAAVSISMSAAATTSYLSGDARITDGAGVIWAALTLVVAANTSLDEQGNASIYVELPVPTAVTGLKMVTSAFTGANSVRFDAVAYYVHNP